MNNTNWSYIQLHFNDLTDEDIISLMRDTIPIMSDEEALSFVKDGVKFKVNEDATINFILSEWNNCYKEIFKAVIFDEFTSMIDLVLKHEISHDNIIILSELYKKLHGDQYNQSTPERRRLEKRVRNITVKSKKVTSIPIVTICGNLVKVKGKKSLQCWVWDNVVNVPTYILYDAYLICTYGLDEVEDKLKDRESFDGSLLNTIV